jgi:hypothetical protein
VERDMEINGLVSHKIRAEMWGIVGSKFIELRMFVYSVMTEL